MDEVRGEKDITKTASPKGENVWTKILSRAESSPSDNSNNMDTIAKELSSAMAAEVLMVFPAKANAMLTDEEIRERTNRGGSVESSLNMLAKYGLLKRGIEVNNKGHCWHMTNLGVEMWEKLRSSQGFFTRNSDHKQADFIEYEHRNSDHQLRDYIRRRYDRRYDEHDYHSVFSIF